jgi:hypothetical protein
VQASEIANVQNLENWLRARPEATMGREAAILSLRMALRLVPVIAHAPSKKLYTTGLREFLFVTFRSLARARSIFFPNSQAKNWLINDGVYFDRAKKQKNSLEKFSVEDHISSAINAAWFAHTGNQSINIFPTDIAISGSFSAPVEQEYLHSTWRAVCFDAELIQTSGYNALLSMPLWPSTSPRPVDFADPDLLRGELQVATNGHVWLRWYDRILNGATVSDEEEMLYSDEELDGLWMRESSYREASAWLAEKLAELDSQKALKNKPTPAPTLPDISDFGSPIAVLNANGKIGLTRNTIYDALDLGTDGLELVHAQQANIRVFTAGLPTQAPEFLRLSLIEYKAALPVEGEGGMALTLDIQADVIVREIKSKAAQEWMHDGVLVVSKNFAKLHPKISALARDNKKREKALAEAPFDEAKADDPAIRQALKDVADAADQAVAANVVEPEVAEQLRNDLRTFDSLLDIKPGDRPAPHSIPPKKRFWFARLGFFKSLQVAGGTTTVVKDGPEAAGNLMAAVKWISAQILKLFAGG